MNFPKRTAIFVSLAVILFFRPGFCGQASTVIRSQDWVMFKSDYFDIYAMPNVDLEAFYKRINRRPFWGMSSNRPVIISSAEEMIANRLDRLMERAERMLDVYPRPFRVNIRIFKDHDQLNSEYFKIFKTTADLRSFYIDKFKTIYLSEEDANDSIAAHEMSHAIVDHYFKIVPPEKIREMIASYVDLHLED